MKLHNRKPDIENLYKVLRREAPSRPTLFELFMNQPLYERLAGRTLPKTGDQVLENLKLVIDAFAAAGYDYATAHASNFGFASNRHQEKQTISLNEGFSETEEETREFLGLLPGERVLTCLSGSRPIEYTEGMKLMVSVARIVTDRFPDIRVLFPLAPTVREDLLQEGLNGYGIQWTGENRVREISLGNGKFAAAVRDRTLEALNCSTLAIAVPGTNNLQAAALYIPYIMVLPLDRADEYPLDGIAGILPLWIPGVKYLKKAYIIRLNERTSFVSLPNKMAGRMIAPEIRGFFDARVVARMAIGLLESPEKLKEISREFWENTHERGAAARLSEYVEKFAKE